MKHINRRLWLVILGVLLIVAVAAWLASSGRRPTLTFLHYEHSKDGTNCVAVLRFTNHSQERVLLNAFLAEGRLSPAYLFQRLHGGDWGEVVNGGTPRRARQYGGTQESVDPDGTIGFKLPIPRDGSSFRVGLKYRTREPRTLRAKLYRLRWRLADWGIGNRPAYQTSMETVWCSTTLTAPAQEMDYAPMTPEVGGGGRTERQRPNMQWYEAEGPMDPANQSVERTVAPRVESKEPPVQAADLRQEVWVAAPVYDMAAVKARAEKGDAAAQTLLAECYYAGTQGLATNRVEGYKWAVVAASQGHNDAKHVLGEFDMFMSASETAKGKALAEAYLERQKKAVEKPPKS